MLFLIAAAGLLAASGGTTKLTTVEARDAVAAVLPQLESIRGLSFAKTVPVSVIGDAKAREYALARFRRLTPEATIRADQTAYRLLGLVPPDTDVVKTLLDVLEEQAGGFYDPQTKSFYLLDDMPRAMTGMLAAHEMTHALEDQRYDLDARIAKVIENDDASFALSSLIEGSASLAGMIYLSRGVSTGKVGADDLREIADSEVAKAERLNAMPGVLRRQLLGPYLLGMSFLARGRPERTANEYPKADAEAAWSKPPVSSEQILHPEKYWDPGKRDEPKPVAIRGASTALGKGWSLTGGGVLGEVTIGSLVGANAPSASEASSDGSWWTNAAASGWGGDRFEVWENGGQALALVATVWDTETDAREFEASLPKGREGFAFRRSGARVGIVAGPAGAKRDPLLALLVRK